MLGNITSTCVLEITKPENLDILHLKPDYIIADYMGAIKINWEWKA